MKTHLLEDQKTALLTPLGMLGSDENEAAIRSATAGLFALGYRRLIVDLSEVRPIRRRGLFLLLHLLARCYNAGVRLTLCGAERHRAALAPYAELFHVVTDCADALDQPEGGLTASPWV